MCPSHVGLIHERMEIAVLSDLHLGPGGRADGFGHDDAHFLKVLDRLEAGFERIVLLGDIWETLTGHLPFAPEGELRRAREAHPEIAARFRRPRYTYVHGNHDLVARVVDGAPEEVEVRAGGVRLLFTHGHQSDVLAHEGRVLGELGVWLGGLIRRLGLARAYELFRAMDASRSSDHASPTGCPVQRWALARAAAREVDVVVTGHTHVAMRTEHGARLFLNSGSCSEGNLSFLRIDTRRGDYAVCSAI